MVYLLSVSLNLEMVQKILNDLREKEPSFTDTDCQKRFMILANDGSVDLLPDEREKAIALLEESKAIIPLWIKGIHQKLNMALGEFKDL